MTLVKKQRPKVRTVHPDTRLSYNEWQQHIARLVQEAQRNGKHLYNPHKN